jgi:hypothetical protein
LYLLKEVSHVTDTFKQWYIFTTERNKRNPQRQYGKNVKRLIAYYLGDCKPCIFSGSDYQMVTQTHTPSSWAQGSDHISQPGLGLAKG